MGAQHCSFGWHALQGAACRKGGGRPSRGGWPFTVVRGVWCQALSLPRPPVPWGGQPGFRDLCFPDEVSVGVGTQQRTHSVRSFEPSLRAVGVAGGCPRGGGAPRHCEGAPGVRRSRPLLAARPWGGQPGPVAHLLWARVRWCGCAARPLGGRPGLGACGWCGACAVFVCWWVRGGAVCAVVSWRLVLPPPVRRPGAPLSCTTLWCCGCTPFPARFPPSAAGYPSSFFCVAAFFTLYSTLRLSALLPGVHSSLPHLRACVCFGIFPCLLPRFLGPLPPLFLDPVRQRKAGGVCCCWGRGLYDDMRTSLAVVGVCVVAAAVSPNVACACVAVLWFFSIPLVRCWRPLGASCAWGLVVWSHGERVRCRCRCLWAPGIPLALLVCSCFLPVACTHTIHSSFHGVGGLFVRPLLLPASVPLLWTCAL